MAEGFEGTILGVCCSCPFGVIMVKTFGFEKGTVAEIRLPAGCCPSSGRSEFDACDFDPLLSSQRAESRWRGASWRRRSTTDAPTPGRRVESLVSTRSEMRIFIPFVLRSEISLVEDIRHQQNTFATLVAFIESLLSRSSHCRSESSTQSDTNSRFHVNPPSTMSSSSKESQQQSGLSGPDNITGATPDTGEQKVNLDHPT